MGRKAAVSSAEKLDAVSSACHQLHITIFDGDVVRGKTDPLWQLAANLLECKISPSTLALDFAKNAHNLREDFSRLHNVTPQASDDHYAYVEPKSSISADAFAEEPAQTPERDGEETSEEDFGFVDASDEEGPVSQIPEKQTNRINDRFQVVIDRDQWQLIQPVKKSRKDGQGTYWELGPEYRNTLLKAIWTNTKIRCCLCIHRQVVRKGDQVSKKFVEISGYCSECRATLNISVDQEVIAEDGSITFDVEILNRLNTKHVKRQKLR